jgi:hypothetical protein
MLRICVQEVRQDRAILQQSSYSAAEQLFCDTHRTTLAVRPATTGLLLLPLRGRPRLEARRLHRLLSRLAPHHPLAAPPCAQTKRSRTRSTRRARWSG